MTIATAAVRLYIVKNTRCVLCHRSGIALHVGRCEVTGEPVVVCLDPVCCLEHAEKNKARIRVERALYALRGSRA